MHVHILGICGTFMAGLATLLKAKGFTVSGTDENIYPPMSTQLEAANIALYQSYDDLAFADQADLVLIGNVIKRGNKALEYVLSNKIPYYSGPEYLYQRILAKKSVIAIAGTHGKTTTSSMIAYLLDRAGFNPSFLIGGIPQNFSTSARLTDSPYFVIEADEYDAAFFDKRAKFVHYRPEVLVLNNLEYDHADIYPDLKTIKKQFNQLIRTIPANGLIIYNALEHSLQDVIAEECYTPTKTFGTTNSDLYAESLSDGSHFRVRQIAHPINSYEVSWQLLGEHNVMNALAALSVCEHLHIPMNLATAYLQDFKNVSRRLEIKNKLHDIVIYDDFAHHPTAILSTLRGLRKKIGKETRLIAILEFGSYTMRTGVHKESLKAALADANIIMCKNTQTNWGLADLLKAIPQEACLYETTDHLVSALANKVQAGDHIIVMSNSHFDNIHDKIAQKVEERFL